VIHSEYHGKERRHKAFWKKTRCCVQVWAFCFHMHREFFQSIISPCARTLKICVKITLTSHTQLCGPLKRGGKKKDISKWVWSSQSGPSFRVCYTSLLSIDETLSSFTKRTHPRKGEKKKQGTWIIVEASKQPKRGRTTRWKGEALSTTQNLH